MNISIFLIYILIVIGSTIISRLKNMEKESRRHNPLSRTDFDLAKEQMNPPISIESVLDKKEELVNTANSIETDSETEKVIEVWKDYDGVEERIIEIDVYDQKPVRRELNLMLEMTPENLLQGIIMAEILKPPRARRPYRPVYLEQDI
ncbi:hypothetical protein BBF96_07045 [Anoxybacter fermentans]|uniref:Uncharacterized protein n=1 Tax=Anoxybacter fermentans TaxID=1323375 RepID=A0A3S9SXY9_9FIRM|nr:hypothetical protein [Anoxybacter fermentans]AZR73161.1 hypothetical protein BBF96_07045 [Anoxybacter fermentans]